MILDPFGEVLAESSALGDDVVVALLTAERLEPVLGPALPSRPPARALRQARRAAAARAGTRDEAGLGAGPRAGGSLIAPGGDRSP